MFDSTDPKQTGIRFLKAKHATIQASNHMKLLDLTFAGPGKKILRHLTKRRDWRDVPLTSNALAALRSQRKRASERSSGVVPATDYVFSNPADGTIPYRPDTFSDRWFTMRGESAVTLLQLRHFAATVMLDAGESYRTVADILGNGYAPGKCTSPNSPPTPD